MACARTGRQWPVLRGWEMYHLKVHPSIRIVSTLPRNGLVRPTHQRSNDGGETWEPLATSSTTTACPARTSGTTAHLTRGSSRGCGTSNRAERPRRGVAGVEDAALSISTLTVGENVSELSVAQTRLWCIVAARRDGMCLHSIIVARRTRSASSCHFFVGGRLSHRRRGKSWRPIKIKVFTRRGFRRGAEVGHCVHTHHDAPFEARHVVHCRSTGT